MKTPESPPPPAEPTSETAAPFQPAPPVVSAKPAWSPTGIAWICILFTLLPAAIMYALNFERMGYPERMRRALYFGLGGCAIYYLLVFRAWMLFGFDSTTSATVRAWFSIAGIVIAWKLYTGQQKLFVRYIRNGGRKASLYLPLALALVWALVLSGVSVVIEYEMLNRNFGKAVVLMNNKRFAEAEEMFEYYKLKDPDEPMTYWNLAVIYDNTGRPELARQELQDMLELDPNNKEAKEFLQELKE